MLEIIVYVWKYGHIHMTELERRCVKAVQAKEKAKNTSPLMAERLLDKWGATEDPGVNEAL